MDIVVKMKNILLAVSVFGSLSLCAMELQICIKSDLNDVLLFAKRICDRVCDPIPYDVATVIVQQSCLFRMKEIYEKFDSLLHFDNEKYDTISLDYRTSRHRVSQDMRKNRRCVADDLKKLSQLTAKTDCCRKFPALEPHHLLLLTAEQDEILLSLLMRSICFDHKKGCLEIKLITKEEEDKQYLLLPLEIREILKKSQISPCSF